jgi:hypothetical protein
LCSWGFAGENWQCRFFDEHGLDTGLAWPGRKIRQGDTLTKVGLSGNIGSADFSTNTGWTRAGRWTGRARQENSLRGHADESRFAGENRQCRFFDEHGLDAGLAGPGRKIHQGDTLTKVGS